MLHIPKEGISPEGSILHQVSVSSVLSVVKFSTNSALSALSVVRIPRYESQADDQQPMMSVFYPGVPFPSTPGYVLAVPTGTLKMCVKIRATPGVLITL